MAIVRAEIDLDWNKTKFTFDDIIGITHYRTEFEVLPQKRVTISNYFQCCMSSIESENLLRKCKFSSDYERAYHLLGAMCLYDYLKLSDMTLENMLHKIRSYPTLYAGDLEKAMNELDLKNEKVIAEVANILDSCYVSNQVLKTMYSNYFDKEIKPGGKLITISVPTYKQCEDLVNNGFSDKYLKLDKGEENESFTIGLFKESTFFTNSIRSRYYPYSTYAEINRLCMSFGIYIMASMIVLGKVNYKDKEVTTAINLLEKLKFNRRSYI